MNKYILEARSLVKREQGKFLLNGIHVHVEKNDVVAFLGDDNQSNEKLIEVLSTMESPSAGDLYINGLNTKFDLKRIKKKINVIFKAFDKDLSSLQNLQVYAKLYEVPKLRLEKKITEYLRVYDMEEYADISPYDLSDFHQFKLAYIRAILTEPDIIFFNEDFSNFDEHETQEILSLFEELKGKVTIVFTTKRAFWAYKLANKVAIFTNGKIYDYGEPYEKLAKSIGQEVIEFIYKEEEIDYFLSRLSADHDYYMVNDRLYLFLKPGQDSKNILDIIHSDEVVIRKPDIKDLLVRHQSNEMDSL